MVVPSEDECENDAIFKYVWIFIHSAMLVDLVRIQQRICCSDGEFAVFTLSAFEPFSQRNQKTGSVSLFHIPKFSRSLSQGYQLRFTYLFIEYMKANL